MGQPQSISKKSSKSFKKDVKSNKKTDPDGFKRIRKVIKVSSKTLNKSICIPTTVLGSCKNLEQITHTLYQIAKSACLFNVAEIVILDVEKESNTVDALNKDSTARRKTSTKIKFGDETEDSSENKPKDANDAADKRKRLSTPMLIATLLQFFVTPPYLVSSVFKKEYMKYFTYAKQLPRITSLPFMRHFHENKGRYREGLAIRMSKPGPRGKSKKAFNQTKYVNVGKGENLELRGQLVPINVRVTVDTIEKKVVSPNEAYGDFVGAKSSFGYHVRVAKSFTELFVQSPFPQGYTQTVWINSGDYFYDETLKQSVKVQTNIPSVTKVVRSVLKETDHIQDPSKRPDANLLIVFGRWDHIKKSFQRSKDQFEGASDAYQFFDGQLDLPGAVPEGQVCTEDACTIALTLLSTI